MSDNKYDKLLNIDWNFPNSQKNKGIHSLHPYPAKFIPDIPRNLLEILGVPENTCVFDPFSGSGTTVVEAQAKGYPAIGVDLNPIACLIAEVKTSAMQDDLYASALDIIAKAKINKDIKRIKDIPNVDHWFKEDIQKAIASLMNTIENIHSHNVQNALKMILSSIIVKVSNQDSDTRYAAVENKITVEDVHKAFLTTAKKVNESLKQQNSNHSSVEIINKNILDVEVSDIAIPVGLVITSPPYPNAYEYWLYHKYRMYWLGHDPLHVRKKEIGARAHYFKKNHPTIDDFFIQMKSVMNLLYKITVSDAHVCFVIGRSKIHGTIYDNTKLIVQAGEDEGFVHIMSIPRDIASSRKSFNLAHASIKTEHLVVFKKK